MFVCMCMCLYVCVFVENFQKGEGLDGISILRGGLRGKKR